MHPRAAFVLLGQLGRSRCRLRGGLLDSGCRRFLSGGRRCLPATAALTLVAAGSSLTSHDEKLLGFGLDVDDAAGSFL